MFFIIHHQRMVCCLIQQLDNLHHHIFYVSIVDDISRWFCMYRMDIQIEIPFWLIKLLGPLLTCPNFCFCQPIIVAWKIYWSENAFEACSSVLPCLWQEWRFQPLRTWASFAITFPQFKALVRTLVQSTYGWMRLPIQPLDSKFIQTTLLGMIFCQYK
jgi:hypothetical protein